MTVAVQRSASLPATADLRTGRPPSTTRIAHPLATAANHSLGHLLGGLRHCQRAWADQSALLSTETARVRTFRHPNCDAVDVYIEVGGDAQGGTWTMAVTAGSGTTQTLSSSVDPADSTTAIRQHIRAPWDSADADEQDVTVEATLCSIRALAVVDVPRESLSPADGDLGVDSTDSDYPAIALLPERPIAASPEAGPGAIIGAVNDAWDNYRPQHLSWWSLARDAIEFTTTSYGGSGSASDVFPGQQLRFQARQKKSGDTRSTVDFWVYCWTSGASGTGQIQVSATNPGAGADDSDTSVSFSGTGKAWRQVTVEVDCTQAAGILIEAKHSTGANTVYIKGVAAIGGA